MNAAPAVGVGRGTAIHRPLPPRGAAPTQELVRRNNLAALLRLVHMTGPTSRADLTGLTGLNRSTVKALSAELVAAGLLREAAPIGTGSAGRPSITVEPESDLIYVLALDVGVDHLLAVRVGLGGSVQDRRALRQSAGDYDVGRTVERLTGLADDLRSTAVPGARCVGVGIGVCGMVSVDDGVVRLAPNLGWIDVPLRRLVAAGLATPLPIVVGNDGDLGVLAEHLRGCAVGLDDVIYLSGEVGIGGGILLRGQPLTGTGGYAGEVGHMQVQPGGRSCRCGRAGCWETEIGEEAVLVSTRAPAGSTLQQVLEAYRDGHSWPRAGMERVGRLMGSGVVDLVNIFNPQAVIFGGLSQAVFLAIEDIVRSEVAGALMAPREQVRLLTPVFGDDAVAVGAAELAFDALLADPLGTLSRLERRVLA